MTIAPKAEEIPAANKNGPERMSQRSAFLDLIVAFIGFLSGVTFCFGGASAGWARAVTIHESKWTGQQSPATAGKITVRRKDLESPMRQRRHREGRPCISQAFHAPSLSFLPLLPEGVSRESCLSMNYYLNQLEACVAEIRSVVTVAAEPSTPRTEITEPSKHCLAVWLPKADALIAAIREEHDNR